MGGTRASVHLYSSAICLPGGRHDREVRGKGGREERGLLFLYFQMCYEARKKVSRDVRSSEMVSGLNYTCTSLISLVGLGKLCYFFLPSFTLISFASLCSKVPHYSFSVLQQ